ncbi:biotin transporter BioY [Salinarimonas soli]|uniref:Biotin transporter n=1 Tax=Salinarimonas soli TaxID=1638099 RepID=A0A5B2VAS7_9HYPH|nr:biotin transporter BioY [Salinarimonas soli]KAA2235469.1 biotin transporter BioY [Salinarimonas soli]
MAGGSNPVSVLPGTVAGLLWPVGERPGLLRSVVLAVLGSALLTLSAKVSVPFWPVPMTLQTLAVLALGALVGRRLAVATVLLYLAQGLAGLPVFVNTPPAVPGPLYLMGPTGGFLAGFVVAAAMVGAAADRGLTRHPVAFVGAVLAADLVLLAMGCLWLAFFAAMPSGVSGIGLAKAFAAGVQPFLLGEALKVAIVGLAVPMLWRGAQRLTRV